DPACLGVHVAESRLGVERNEGLGDSLVQRRREKIARAVTVGHRRLLEREGGTRLAATPTPEAPSTVAIRTDDRPRDGPSAEELPFLEGLTIDRGRSHPLPGCKNLTILDLPYHQFLLTRNWPRQPAVGHGRMDTCVAS